jgi:hypothetical protein
MRTSAAVETARFQWRCRAVVTFSPQALVEQKILVGIRAGERGFETPPIS